MIGSRESSMEREARYLADSFKSKISELYLMIQCGEIKGEELSLAKKALTSLKEKLDAQLLRLQVTKH